MTKEQKINKIRLVACHYISELRGSRVMPDDVNISHNINCKLQDKGLIGKVRPKMYCSFNNGILEIMKNDRKRKPRKGYEFVHWFTVYSERIFNIKGD